MKFELNEIHRNVSDEELIQDVVAVANRIGRKSLTIDEYEANGRFHSTTIRRRFGSWKNILEMAGLATTDPLFGKRNHSADPNSKTPTKKSSYFY